MKPARAMSERRVYPRHRVRVAVLWRNRPGETMPGEICDVSVNGLFLVSTTALPDDVGVGDRTQVVVRSGNREEILAGIVRWRGYHPQHGAIGCGLQLDEASVKVMARLFPALQTTTSRS